MKKLILVGLDAIIPKFAERFIREGKMPNLKKMVDSGYWTAVTPTFPCVTPPGWATIGTGAWPSTHGIEGFTLHFGGDSLEKMHNGFNSKFCKAKYLWEVAEEENREVILLKYPGSWPHRMKKAIQVGGAAGYGGRKSVLDITHSLCFSTGEEREVNRITVSTLKEWRNIPLEKKSSLEVELVFPTGERGEAKVYHGLISKVNGRYKVLRLCRSRDYETVLANLSPGDWSDWIEDTFVINGAKKRGHFRLKLMDISPDGRNIKVYVTQNHPIQGYTTPPELAAELYKNVGPFQEYTGPQDLWNGWIDLKTQWEIYRSHVNYMKSCMNYLLKRKSWDIFVMQCHPLDYAQHIVWAGIDPGHPDYDPEKADQYWSILGDLYGMMDLLIGEALEHTSEDTFVVVAGDHGHELYTKTLFINNLLLKKGLLVAQKNLQTGNFEIDWSRSKAFAAGHISIFVNLKGREPKGIVKPGDEYEELRERLINLLYDIKDEETHQHPIKCVCRKEELDAWGLYGNGIGDVVYMTRRGYDSGSAMRLDLDSKFLGITDDKKVLKRTKILEEHTSEHPDFSPFSETMRTLFAVLGPNIKKGYQRPRPIRLVDIACTLAELIEVSSLPQAEGSVISDIYQD